MTIVSDTSTISNLYQIGLLTILYELFGEITITPAVRRELYVLSEQSTHIEQLEWIKVKSPENQKMIADLLKELELGEAESITLAIEEKAEYLLIDEYKGRKIAVYYGVNIVGVLGILIQAKKKGIIPLVGTNLEKLVQIGFRLDKSLVEKVLEGLDEL